MRATAVDFLDPKDADCRLYVIWHLNAYFFLEATQLKKRTLEVLAQSLGQRELFSILIDTNFLFSILSLHENPCNEAVHSLVGLIEKISQFVTVNLYVFPLTIDEAKRVLQSCQSHLAGLRLTPNLAEAAQSTRLSGLIKKYVEECRKVGRPISAESYFGPYITRLIEILSSKGVRFLDEDLRVYKDDPSIGYEIERQMDYEWHTYGKRGKDYKALEHDIILWHFTRQKRPAYVESPLDAKYWIVTVDYGLLGFDAHERERGPNGIPVCLDPTALIQMLQFWLPRTAELEEAVLSNLRLPFLFQAFDPSDEAVTVDILQVMSRFEDIGDLSVATVTNVLLDQALRQRMSAEKDSQKHIELVEESIAAQEVRLREELEDARGQARQEMSAREEAQQRLAYEANRMKAVDQQLQEERQARRSLEERLKRFEDEAQERASRESTRKRIVGFCLKWVLSPLALILLLTYVIFLLLLNSPQFAGLMRFGRWWPAIGVWSILMLPYVLLVDRRGAAEAIIRDWPPFSCFRRFKKRLLVLLGTLSGGIVANALYDLIKLAIARSRP